MKPDKKLDQIKAWARKLKQDLRALQIALSENLVPWHVKLLIIFTLGYALSPIDLIPDFIPVIGLLDDLLILPVLIYLAIRLIPEKTMAYCRNEAEKRPWKKRKNWVAGLVVIVIWLMLIAWILFQFFPEKFSFK